MQDPDDPDEAVESRPSAAAWKSSRHRADAVTGTTRCPRRSTAMTAEERLLMEEDGETKEQRWNPKMQGFAHNTARTGFLEGEMALPRHDAYTIEFTITKRNPMADDLGDPTDRCTVKLGPNLRNLQEVAVAKNIVDEYAGCARYEFTHGMRTDTLAWRFEFMSST